MATRENVLLTGASSGIGLELARRFARAGHDLTLVARNEGRLRALADELRGSFGVEVRVLSADLSEPDAAARVMASVREASWPVHILVNNAGYATYGPLVETDVDETMRMIGVNVSALVQFTGLVLPEMVERRQGRVLNVASTAAFQPGPGMAAYYASKAFVLSFSEGLAEELRHTGVTVTALCPGPTWSGFQDRAGMQGSRTLTGLMPVMRAGPVAECAYQALMQGRTLVIPGLLNQVLAFGNRFMPRALVTRISGWLAARS